MPTIRRWRASLEVGIKINPGQTVPGGTNVMPANVSLTAALFRTEKNNALTRDPATGNVQGLGGEQVVEGIELGMAGNITQNWQVFARYAWMSGRGNRNGGGATGVLSNFPESSGNLWTTYSLLDKKLQFGFGVQYMDDIRLGRTNSVVGNTTTFAPSYLVFDAMASYQFTPKFGLRLNIYSIGDDRYVDGTGGTVNQFEPGLGRSVALTASVKF